MLDSAKRVVHICLSAHSHDSTVIMNIPLKQHHLPLLSLLLLFFLNGK